LKVETSGKKQPSEVALLTAERAWIGVRITEMMAKMAFAVQRPELYLIGK